MAMTWAVKNTKSKCLCATNESLNSHMRWTRLSGNQQPANMITMAMSMRFVLRLRLSSSCSFSLVLPGTVRLDKTIQMTVYE